MSKIIAAALVLVLFLSGIVPNSVQASGGPTKSPWLRIYQVDPRWISAGDSSTGIVLVFDTLGAGWVESVQLCESGGCGRFPVGYPLGRYNWEWNISSGWVWVATKPFTLVGARAYMVAQDGRQETITAESIEVQPSTGASGEVSLRIKTAPQKIGDRLELEIDRDLPLPVMAVHVCVNGPVWGCQYEASQDWGFLLNGSGTQSLSLTLDYPNLIREGPDGKLKSFPDGATIQIRYDLIDGSSFTRADILRFLP